MLRVPTRVADALEPDARERSTWFLVFVGFVLLYSTSAHWRVGHVTDGVAAAWPGWSLAHHGTWFLDAAGPPSNPWIHPGAEGRLAAFRTAGVVWIGAPVNLLLGWTGLPATSAAALTAVLVTSAALANTAVLLRSFLPHRAAVTAVVTLGTTTSFWTVASAELWTHGPDLLWLSAGLLALTRDRLWWCGAALAAGFTTRPHLALVAVVLATALAAARRSLRPLLALGLPGLLAAGLVLVWNRHYLGQTTLIGGYSGYQERVVTGLGGPEGHPWAVNLLGMAIAPTVGVLAFTPLVAVLAAAVARTWRLAPAWTRWAAVAGALYTGLQAKLNNFSGGGGYYGYRLTLEGLFLCAPLAASAWWVVSRRSARWRLAVNVTAAASFVVMAFGANSAYYWRGSGVSDWSPWYPWFVGRAAGVAAVPVLLAAGGVVLLVALARRPSGPPAAP